MTTIQLTGKPAEVRKQFEDLAFSEDAQICLTIDELTPEMQAKREHAEMMLKYDKEFAQYRSDDGIVRIPNSEAATLEQVQELMLRLEMEEVLGEHAAMMCRYDEEFADVPRVYGILQVPTSEPMTVERIKELSED